MIDLYPVLQGIGPGRKNTSKNPLKMVGLEVSWGSVLSAVNKLLQSMGHKPQPFLGS